MLSAFKCYGSSTAAMILTKEKNILKRTYGYIIYIETQPYIMVGCYPAHSPNTSFQNTHNDSEVSDVLLK